MMKRSYLALAILVTVAAIAVPASAQQINGILLNDSTQPPAWDSWDSIYGTNLPVGSDTTVTLIYSTTQGQDVSQIDAGSAHQTFWFDSATQINFFPYPQNLVGNSGTVLSTTRVQVCGSGLCTNEVTINLTGVAQP